MENITALSGDCYVSKTHPRILFRGAIDSFIAELLLIMANALKTHAKDSLFLLHLYDVKQFLKAMQAAEASGTPLAGIRLLDMDENDLREHSHHPHSHIGIGHIFDLPPDADIRALQMNYLRAKARELEIKGIAAETNDPAINENWTTALNRLSSALYIMELRIVAGHYS